MSNWRQAVKHINITLSDVTCEIEYKWEFVILLIEVI